MKADYKNWVPKGMIYGIILMILGVGVISNWDGFRGGFTWEVDQGVYTCDRRTDLRLPDSTG